MSKLEQFLDQISPEFKQAPQEVREQVLEKLSDPHKLDQLLSSISPEYAQADNETKQKVISSLLVVGIPEKLGRALGYGVGELLEDTGTIIKKGAQLLGAEEGETPFSDKLIEVGERIKEKFIPKEYEKVYKIPIVSDIVEEVPSLIPLARPLKWGAEGFKALTKAEKLGKLGEAVAEQVGAGLVYSGKEYLAGDYSGEDVLKQVPFDVAVGALGHTASKALSKVLKGKT